MDTDMAEAMVKLSSEETFYQAALQMAARISGLNLMSYL
jgi:flagellin-like hook-associated protein FlgL